MAGTQTTDLSFSSNPSLTYSVSITSGNVQVTISETTAGTYNFNVLLDGALKQTISVQITPGKSFNIF
jgi:hypothetical protein